MRRREFITLLGCGAAAWPLSARSQPASKIFRIGFVGLPAADSLPKQTEAFRVGLRDLGYEEGRNIVIEFRWAGGHYERLPALFSELIRLNVDVIVTYGTAGGLAANRLRRRYQSYLPRRLTPSPRVSWRALHSPAGT